MRLRPSMRRTASLARASTRCAESSVTSLAVISIRTSFAGIVGQTAGFVENLPYCFPSPGFL